MMVGTRKLVLANTVAVVAILIASFHVSPIATAQVFMNPTDCETLASWSLFASTVGLKCGPKVPCPTSGVQCTADGRVRAVVAMDAGLTGPLPADWSDLAAVQELRLGNNSIGGTLPASWGNLKKLRVLHLEFNQLVGTLPEAWANMTSLGFLYIQGNEITGSIPGAWRDLQKLKGFDTRGTQLCGPNPTSSSLALPTCDEVAAQTGGAPTANPTTRSTSTPAPTPAQKANHGQGSFAESTGLSKGAAIGIAVGVAAGLALICAAACFFMNRRKAKKQQAAGLPVLSKEVEFTPKAGHEPAAALPVPRFVPKRGSSKRGQDGMDTVSLRDSNEHSATHS